MSTVRQVEELKTHCAVTKLPLLRHRSLVVIVTKSSLGGKGGEWDVYKAPQSSKEGDYGNGGDDDDSFVTNVVNGHRTIVFLYGQPNEFA